MTKLEFTSNQLYLLRTATESAYYTNLKQLMQGINNKSMQDDLRRINKDLEVLIKKLQGTR